MIARRLCTILGVCVIGISVSIAAWADPLAGERLKFQQLPLNNGGLPTLFNAPPLVPPPIGAPFYGHDEISTATLLPSTNGQVIYQGPYMADDFADHFDTPVFHVRWWGSYQQNFTGNTAAPGVKQFLISFENDVPAVPPNTTGFSHPGEIKFNQIVSKGPLAPGSGTFTEKVIPTPPIPGTPGPPETLYEYNAELNFGKEFVEHHDTVYWLKIVALVDSNRDGPILWGWHDRDWSIPDPLASTPPAVVPGEGIVGVVGPIPPLGGTLPVWHFQDDAVTGPVTVTIDPTMPIMPTVAQPTWAKTTYISPADGPEQIQQFSKDLAFELYTRVPEPATLGMMAVGAVALLGAHRRRVGS